MMILIYPFFFVWRDSSKVSGGFYYYLWSTMLYIEKYIVCMSKESEGIKERQTDRLTFDSDREGGKWDSS